MSIFSMDIVQAGRCALEASRRGLRAAAARWSAAMPLLLRPACAAALGLAAGAAAYAGFDAATRPRAAANVVLIVVDTLRADHMGCYGYSRDTSPRMDALAAEATRCERNKSQASVTTASMSSMFTSKLLLTEYIPDRLPSLPEVLQSHGYRTFGIQTNPWLDSTRGFTRGFDEYVMLTPPGGQQRLREWRQGGRGGKNTFYADADAVRNAALARIDALEPGRPFFLYVHYMDVHGPYIPKPRYDVFSLTRLGLKGQVDLCDRFVSACHTGDFATFHQMRPAIEALYDGQIREADASIGDVLDRLKARGLYDDTIVVVAADHGEEFGEHDIVQHSNGLYETQIHTPLIIRYPGCEEGDAHAGLTRNLDIMPSILSALGFRARHLDEYSFDGIPAGSAAPDAPEVSRAVFLKERTTGSFGYFAAECDGFKLIVEARRPRGGNQVKEKVMLFNVWRDPRETVRLEEALPEKVEELWGLLPRYRLPDEAARPLTRAVSEEQKRQLQALGYLD